MSRLPPGGGWANAPTAADNPSAPTIARALSLAVWTPITTLGTLADGVMIFGAIAGTAIVAAAVIALVGAIIGSLA